MESLDDEPWDVAICGTGLQQSLLALALSRSKKRILHLDPNHYYGEHEAAFTLSEADTWASSNARPEGSAIFRDASTWQHPEAQANGLAAPRAYALALAPQIIHTRSLLLSQLVSSRAFRQIEFLAVGAFFVYDGAASGAQDKLARVPSSREDIFANKAIPIRSKRSLMKFLKFVADYDSEEQKAVWQGHADKPLAGFLGSEFNLDDTLRRYILALTLALDDAVPVGQGLATLHRHLTSTGLFGPGFCAVYPKWGGLSEVAQVACRAGAVGGGIYMLGTSMRTDGDAKGGRLSLALSNEMKVETAALISSQSERAEGSRSISRLVAVVNYTLPSLFETSVEGAPTPAVAVVAFPTGTVLAEGAASEHPIYAFVHSSDTGECPQGQCVIYLTTSTTTTPHSSQLLDSALDALLQAEHAAALLADEGSPPLSLYKLRYEQGEGTAGKDKADGAKQSRDTANATPALFTFPAPSLSLAFDDAQLGAVREAWELVAGPGERGEQVAAGQPEEGEAREAGEEVEYMVFQDREGVGEEDDDIVE